MLEITTHPRTELSEKHFRKILEKLCFKAVSGHKTAIFNFRKISNENRLWIYVCLCLYVGNFFVLDNGQR